MVGLGERQTPDRAELACLGDLTMSRTGILAALAVVLAGTASAETITVCSKGCDYTSINAAIAAASSGDIIQLAGETYQEGVEIDTLGKAITLRGTVDADGVPTSVLDGQGMHRVVVCQSAEFVDTRFENLIIRDGAADRGAGMANLATSPTIMNCVFEGNVASDRGGGLYINNGAPVVSCCDFLVNSASDLGGAIYVRNSRPVILESVFEANVAGRGGAIGVWGLPSYPEDFVLGCRLEAINCMFVGNEASGMSGGQGGAMVLFQSAGTAEGCMFIENRVSGSHGGGAIRVLGVRDAAVPGRAEFSVLACEFEANSARFGGAIHATVGVGLLALQESVFRGNTAELLGGAVHLGNGPLAIDGCSFEVNQSPAGTGLSGDPSLAPSSWPVLSNCSFASCCEMVPPWSFTDGGGNDYQAWCDDCRADVNCQDDAVDAADLAYMLGVWGTADPQCDITGDGIVDGADLGALLISWGPCP